LIYKWESFVLCNIYCSFFYSVFLSVFFVSHFLFFLFLGIYNLFVYQSSFSFSFQGLLCFLSLCLYLSFILLFLNFFFVIKINTYLCFYCFFFFLSIFTFSIPSSYSPLFFYFLCICFFFFLSFYLFNSSFFPSTVFLSFYSDLTNVESSSFCKWGKIMKVSPHSLY